MSRSLGGTGPPREAELDRKLPRDVIDLFPAISNCPSLRPTTTPHIATGVQKGTYRNKRILRRGTNSTLRIHVKNSSAPITRRPREDARVRVQVEVAAVMALELEVKVDLVNTALRRLSREGEGVLAEASGPLRDLGVAEHVGGHDGEPAGLRQQACF